jgi:hypothetical protein
MTNREHSDPKTEQEKDRKLTLDKEEVKDLEPKPEDQDHVRGGMEPSTMLSCSLATNVTK